MNIRKTLLRLLFVIVLFTAETLFEIICIVLLLCITDRPYSFDLADLGNMFSDSWLVIFPLKVIFFLPVYILFYLLRPPDISRKFIWIHLGIHTACIVLVALVLAGVIFTPNGLTICAITTVASALIAWFCQRTLRAGYFLN